MIPAEYSGICFTIDPTDVEQQWMMIESHEGIGADVVGGKVNPFRYRIHRKSFEIKKASSDDKFRFFSIDKIVELARICLKIENQLNSPQDIEWAFHQNQFYLLQSRPITQNVRKPIRSKDKLWCSYFFGERFPQPVSPLGWSMLKPLIEKNAFREPLQFLGFHKLARSRITKCFNGRPYTKLEVFQALHSLFPTAYISADKRKLFYDQPVSFRQCLTKILKNIFPILKSLISTTDWIPPIHLRNWKRFLDYYCLKIKSLNKLELPMLSDDQLWQLNLQAEQLSDQLLELHRWSLTFAELIYYFLILLIRKWLPQMNADQIVISLHRGIAGNKTVEMNTELWKLSQENRFYPPTGKWNWSLMNSPALKSFIKKFGHRSTSLDIAVPPFAEDSDFLRSLIQPYLSLAPELPPEPKHKNFEQQRINQRQTVFENLSKQSSGFLKKQFFKMLLNWSEQFFLLRENQRHYWHQALAINRKIFLVFGKRLVDRGWLENQDHIFFLKRNEIERALSLQQLVLKFEIKSRIRQHQEWQAIHPPAIIDESLPIQLAAKSTDKKLVGIGAGPGMVTGKARVLTALQEMAQIQPGEILVVPTTDPGWTPLFGMIQGLVMEVGGILSHGAIVAREFGIPAVTSVAQSSSRIVTGMKITVDGNKGEVWIHED
jgi:pyruvate,water dikinase